jgi:hypothetical protein
MLGFFTVELPSGLIINDCRLMVGPLGKRWIAPPSVRETDREGNIKIGLDGKPTWQPIIEFRDKPVRSRWQNEILTALRKAHPEAFDDGDEP